MSHNYSPATSLSGGERVRVIAASAAGNFAEWFDFGLYGVVATVLAGQFFPAGDPTVALISTYAIFALTYFTRPAGGLLAGWLGDTFGRRAALFISISIMTVGTGLIGILPTYETIGIAAPIMLLACRLLQGIGAGGEYGSAVTFIAEHSSDKDRAVNVSYVVGSTFLGVLSAVGLAAATSTLLGDTAFETWGWRILFLLAVPLGLLGIYIRRRVSETAAFEDIAADRKETDTHATPIRTALKSQWPTIILFILIVAVYALITPTLSSYFITFLKGPGELSGGEAYTITMIADVLLIVAALVAGRLMQRIGLYKLMLFGSIFVAITAVPAFSLSTLGFAGAIAGGILLAAGKGALAVPAALSIAALFPANVRVTGGSLAYNLTVVLFGASGPLLGVWLNDQMNSPFAFSFYLAAIAAISAIATFIGRTRMGKSSFDQTHSPAEKSQSHR